MALLALQNIQLSFGSPALLDGLDFAIERSERICLIGRNGAGKSTLMKILTGELAFDDGQRIAEGGLKVAMLQQDVPDDFAGRVFDMVAEGVGEMAGLLQDYHAALNQLSISADDAAMDHLARAQQALEAVDGWQLEQQVERVISDMQLDPEADFSGLSGGMKRRVLLARALAGRPNLLLLDEPTNHLDIEAIDWLEGFLKSWQGSLLFVTHDRAFLRSLATRIVELDRGKIYSWPGDYDNYLRRKAEVENAEQKENARFDKRMAQEEVWIRQGIKARRTRNEGRVRQLEAMREKLQERRNKQGSAKLQITAAERSGKLVCELINASYGWGDKSIVKNLDLTVMRGDRIGVVGPNGCGKSTLLNLILGKLSPDSGEIKLGTNQHIAYFDQLRQQLNPDWTVAENVAEGGERVEINGKSKHVIGYLQDFLFTPDRARQPIDALSGGELNRLLLAKLFSLPANVLVMDEPTNDLDVETLELLEDLLVDFGGTLLLVSHDRAFLDNVVTSTLVFEGEGKLNAYVGGYADWLAQKALSGATSKQKDAAKKNVGSTKKKPEKRSYKVQRELDQLPGQIEELETKMETLQAALADPDLYKESPERMNELSSELTDTEKQLETAYQRWDQLDG